MASSDHIRNPAEWSVDQLRTANLAVERAGHALRKPTQDARSRGSAASTWPI